MPTSSGKAVFEHIELISGKPGYWPRLVIDDADLNGHELGARAKDGLRRRGRR